MRKIFFLLVMVIIFPGTTAHAVTIYVDADDTTVTCDGTTWATAYTDLQDALDAASSGDEIWVAAGTYYPGTSRSSYFQMVEGVAIYGGFYGNETDLDGRDPAANETILSGDIDGDDTLNDGNVYHVFYNTSDLALTSAAVLEGFTITGGYADGSSPHCNGGGIFNNSSSPTISNCTFSGNSAMYGGGMYNANASSPTVSGCTFSKNTAGGDGGGMFSTDSDPVVTNCTFSGNSASIYGGGMYNIGNSETAPEITNSVFSGNSAGRGGAIRNNSSSPSITNCTFSGNTASYYGGAIYFYGGSPVLTNCILWGDTAGTNGNEVHNGGSTITYYYCDVEGSGGSDSWDSNLGNDGDDSNEGTNIDADPLFVGDPDIDNDDYGDLHLTYLSPCIDTGGASTEDMDMDGEERIFDGDGNGTEVVDIGADEWVDTDEDGFSDYEEENVYGTCPDDTDTDDDGLSDYEEVITYGTYPTNSDSDGDGYNDGAEICHDSDPTDVYDTPSAMTIYVDVDATDGSNNGSSWNDALTDLQDAITFSISGDQIWVAEGIYYPSSQPNIDPDQSSVRYNHFSMKKGVAIYGGFYGNETDLDGRDPAANETILSGDFNETTDDDTDNCYHVFYHPSDIALDDTAVLSGFTISGGYAYGTDEDDYGGGMYNESSSPTIEGCTFSENNARYGGGMTNDSSSPTLTNCTLSGNYACDGGGMYNTSSSPTLASCTFSGNYTYFYGGGMYNTSSSPTITSCTFSGNYADNDGGGMENYNSSSPILTNCTFSGNEGRYGGGMDNTSSSPTLTNCTFIGNEGSYGGGMDNYFSSSPTLTNCTFSGNESYYGGGMYNYSSSPTLKNCVLWRDTAEGSGNEVYNNDDDSIPTFYYCDVEGSGGSNGWDTDLGTDSGNNIDSDPKFDSDSIHLTVSSPCLDAGSDTAATGIEEDIDGEDRLSGTVDIGADEFYDSDGDGLSDYMEVNVHYTESGNTDTDGDGLTDYEEVITYGTDPRNSDSNKDSDTDGDGLTNGEEVDTYGTDPTDSDSDKDSDTDGDGLTNGEEVDTCGTDPTDEDTDGDGYNDLVEIIHNSEPTEADSTPTGGLTIYVDADATGDEDGTSWDDAFTALQAAITVAVSDDAIWVAEGTYYPTSWPNGGSADREMHFSLEEGVSVYGGFNGTEDDLDDRDIEENVTILSGDIDKDGILDSGNCYHVFYHTSSLGLTSAAVLDGFTVTGGYANGSSPHCDGGGIFNNASSPTIINCTFSGNSATYGGGMYNIFSSMPTLTNCTFSGNTATNKGGGIFNNDSSPTLTNCTFSGNTATSDGGGIFNHTSCTPTLTNCTFSGNTATNNGGGICNNAASPALTNCTFSGNTADGYGGAIFNYSSSSPALTNCILWGDTANSDGDEVYNDPDEDYPSIPTFYYCDIEGSGDGWDSDLGNDGDSNNGNNIDSDPVFVRNPGTNGDDDYGDLHLTASSPCIDKGDPSTIAGTDMDGEDRVVYGDGDDDKTAVVDIGADEFVDSDGDGTADVYESPAIVTSVSSVTISESGATATFTVTLKSPPDGDVVIDFTVSDDTELAVSQASLTFTADNWNTGQTVTITGLDDDEKDGDQEVTITAAINGDSTTDTTGYADLGAVTVQVVNTDNDSDSQSAASGGSGGGGGCFIGVIGS